MQTFLTVASHWHVPGIRQYATQDRAAAERKAAELVEELRAEWESGDAEHDRDAHAPPPIQGSDWETTLRALQLVRLIDYAGGEGEANDYLYAFCERRCEGEPPLIGEGFTPKLQEIVRAFVEEDDCDADKIGFPMVWIETVEEVPVENLHGAGPDLDLVLSMAARFAREGAIADDEDREPGDPLPADVEAAIARLRAGMPAVPPAIAEPKPVRMILSMEGGIVQGGWSAAPVDVTIFDDDTEGADAERVVDVPQDNGSTAEAYIGGVDLEVNPDFVARVVPTVNEAVRRQENNLCLKCGCDLDAPSAAGAEDGVCGPCTKADE
jgi:hypothetical protein